MASSGVYSVDSEDEDEPPRWGFFKVVCLVVLVQLIFTIVPVYVVVGVDILRNFHADHRIFALVPLLISLIVFLCFRFIFTLRHTAPYNYICMVTQTVALTCVLLFYASDTQINKIIIGTAIAVFVCVLIFLLALFGGCDSTVLNMDVIAVIALLVFIILIVLYFVLRNIIILLAAACLGILLSSFDLLFHNQLTLAKNCKYAFDIDEYLLAAMTVYIDIVILAFLLTLMVDTAFRIAANEKK